jgi:hypothetical protein
MLRPSLAVADIARAPLGRVAGFCDSDRNIFATEEAGAP